MDTGILSKGFAEFGSLFFCLEYLKDDGTIGDTLYGVMDSPVSFGVTTEWNPNAVASIYSLVNKIGDNKYTNIAQALAHSDLVVPMTGSQTYKVYNGVGRSSYSINVKSIRNQSTSFVNDNVANKSTILNFLKDHAVIVTKGNLQNVWNEIGNTMADAGGKLYDVAAIVNPRTPSAKSGNFTITDDMIEGRVVEIEALNGLVDKLWSTESDSIVDRFIEEANMRFEQYRASTDGNPYCAGVEVKLVEDSTTYINAKIIPNSWASMNENVPLAFFAARPKFESNTHDGKRKLTSADVKKLRQGPLFIDASNVIGSEKFKESERKIGTTSQTVSTLYLSKWKSEPRNYFQEYYSAIDLAIANTSYVKVDRNGVTEAGGSTSSNRGKLAQIIDDVVFAGQREFGAFDHRIHPCLFTYTLAGKIFTDEVLITNWSYNQNVWGESADFSITMTKACIETYPDFMSSKKVIASTELKV